MATEKTNHKGMNVGRPIGAELFHRFLSFSGYDELKWDPATQGGIVRKNGQPMFYVRSPFWRAEEDNPNVDVKTDIRPLFLSPKESVNFSESETGAELEMYVWDPKSKEMAPVMTEESAVPSTLISLNNGVSFEEEESLFEGLNDDARKIGFSAEFTKACIELNFHHSKDVNSVALSTLRSLKKLAGVAEQQGWLLTPSSSFAHRPLEKDDVSDDAYVKRIAFEYMGWENVRHFVGSSFQVHVEMLDIESAIKAANLYQLISPLLYSLSLAGPFVHGKVNPNLAEIYREEDRPEKLLDTETYSALDDNDWMSVRQASRWRGSPSGGVFEHPLPETQEGLLNMAEEGLKDNDHHSIKNIPSPARVAGHHRDRIRMDIGPHGTLEISNMDTFGGNVLKLAAIQEFTRALVWKLQVYAKSGRLNELAVNHPALFKYPVTEESLKNAHMSSLAVAKKGVSAEVQGYDGKKHTAQELFNELLGFVNEPMEDAGLGLDFRGLSKGVNEELIKSSQVPTDETLSQHQEDGVTSVAGFYETGVGTLSHWLKRRAKDLMAKGFDEVEAIKDCMTNLGEAYHAFLKQTAGEKVVELFN